MIIGCPNCSSRFLVKAEAIGENGRKVKCARCKHVWFQQPDVEALKAAVESNAVEVPKEIEPVPEGSNVPAIPKKKANIFLKIAALISFIFFVFTLSLVASHKIVPKMSFYYSLFGIYDTTDMALYDVKVEKVTAGKYNDVLISGKIANESEIEKRLPALRMTILSETGESLRTVTLAPQGLVIKANEKMDFNDKIEKLPNNAAKIIMDLGDSLDLASR
jgi:predicted Zn finger-like uncharacterized protein